jgi:hypothetical protein
MRIEGKIRPNADPVRTREIRRLPANSRPQASAYRRPHQRRRNTDYTVPSEPRPGHEAFFTRPHRRPVREQFEKLDVPRFFRRNKTRASVILVAPALGDRRTQCTGMLPIKSG